MLATCFKVKVRISLRASSGAFGKLADVSHDELVLFRLRESSMENGVEVTNCPRR